MRIHTDHLDMEDLGKALAWCKREGLVADHVCFMTLDEHGSRKRDHAFEVRLSTYVKVKGDLRSWINTGQYGAGDEYGATYDEYGFFLAALFVMDEGITMDYYPDLWHFIELTGRRRNSRQRVFDYYDQVSEMLEATGQEG